MKENQKSKKKMANLIEDAIKFQQYVKCKEEDAKETLREDPNSKQTAYWINPSSHKSSAAPGWVSEDATRNIGEQRLRDTKWRYYGLPLKKWMASE